MTIGFRILSRRRKVSVAHVEKFKSLPVSNVSDVMSRMTATGARLRPMHASGVLAGPAFTVKTRPGDNLMVHKAIDIAEPGDVIVVDAGGDLTNAIIGEMMLSHAVKRGIAGFVINGAIRDVATIRKGHAPVYAAGVTHRGPYKNGPGEINNTIAIAGMVIEPGDLVLGDEDGLVCIPFDAVDAVLANAQAKHKAEVAQMAAILAGTSNRKWIDDALNQLGCDVTGK
jgi:regulator of RNase E activity RraA